MQVAFHELRIGSLTNTTKIEDAEYVLKFPVTEDSTSIRARLCCICLLLLHTNSCRLCMDACQPHEPADSWPHVRSGFRLAFVALVIGLKWVLLYMW